MKKKATIFASFAATALLLAGCGSDSDNASGDDSGLNLHEEGKLTYASSGLYKPFSFTDGGDLTGFDVEVGAAIAEEMGLEPNPITTPWETITQSLLGNKFDAIIGSMAITEERSKRVAFSDPYYYSGGMIFVPENSDIASADDLKGKTIGVVAQSTYDTAAQEYTDDIKYYNSDVVALKDLTVEGRLDAVITADVVGYEAISSGMAIKEVGDPLWIEQAAVAVRPDDEELLNEINDALAAIIEDGTYEEISNKWFDRDLLDVDLEGIEILK
ncbi:transporter substrate-binding domain-containing protein [Paenisporosarcina cavernae]|uniref:ABC transporter substrate-binding protein n=1 Tax=Paenisporosarcina cavernae TaxID=2320858 RepID=A0A385YS56_9BACL|nr:transporter substrate-binding domain-containing protein [Paenisporosarcina cavernae]AYC28568.1 ABC transporter substrate-binding protein [Paenisporosarcina cavernae]